MLKFSIAYGASFAQVLVKKFGQVRSGHEVMTSQREQPSADFSEIVSKRNLAWCD